MMGFEQTLRSAGLMPRALVPDGKIRRCATADKPHKRNGWYVLNPDGTGSWGDWTSGSGDALGHWRENESDIRLPTGAELAARAARRDAERRRRIAAIHAARDAWSRAVPLRGLHPYIEKKGLTAVGCTGLRRIGDKLVIPVLWKGRVISIQTIAPDGEKRFWPGAPVKGGCYVMQRAASAVTAVCEGFATGLAIYQSIRLVRVIVAFDAGNLATVIEHVQPRGSVVICADDDHGTEAKRGFNPGRQKAEAAAALIGAGVAWPQGIDGTDWADALMEFGEGGARQIERQILARAKYVIAPTSGGAAMRC